MEAVELASRSAEQTEHAAETLGRHLSPGDIVLVSGDVGTGKTTFVRAACRGLGVRDRVTSPSFTIGQTYAGRVPVSHVDLFRLETLEGEDPSLLEDYLSPRFVVFIEWPSAAIPGVEPERIALQVRLSHLGRDHRGLRLAGRTQLVSSFERALEGDRQA
jgi:tRNA threonylcarbamoyladenosine biosynthesis protein TsaE